MDRVYNVRLNAKIRSSQLKTTEDTVIRTTPQSCIDNGRHSDTNHVHNASQKAKIRIPQFKTHWYKVVLSTEDTVI